MTSAALDECFLLLITLSPYITGAGEHSSTSLNKGDRCALSIGQIKVLGLKQKVADLLTMTLGQDTRAPEPWGLFRKQLALSQRCLLFALPLKLTECGHSLSLKVLHPHQHVNF